MVRGWGVLPILDETSDVGQWAVCSGQLKVDSGQLIVDSGQLIVDSGHGTVDNGQASAVASRQGRRFLGSAVVTL